MSAEYHREKHHHHFGLHRECPHYDEQIQKLVACAEDAQFVYGIIRLLEDVSADHL